MTMTTHIYVLDPVNPERLYAHMHALVGGAPDAKVRREPGHIHNYGNQGFAAWLEIDYAVDAPLRPEVYNGEMAEPGQPYCVDASFDTPYGYKTANGAGCGDLHAWIIRETAAWLLAEYPQARWFWWNGETNKLSGLEFLPGDPERGAFA